LVQATGRLVRVVDNAEDDDTGVEPNADVATGLLAQLRQLRAEVSRKTESEVAALAARHDAEALVAALQLRLARAEVRIGCGIGCC
jgi:hypothetical protein